MNSRFYFDGRCAENCSEGLFPIEVFNHVTGGRTNRCELCHGTCQTCSGGSPVDCIRCFKGLVLSAGRCVAQCETKYACNFLLINLHFMHVFFYLIVLCLLINICIYLFNCIFIIFMYVCHGSCMCLYSSLSVPFYLFFSLSLSLNPALFLSVCLCPYKSFPLYLCLYCHCPSFPFSLFPSICLLSLFLFSICVGVCVSLQFPVSRHLYSFIHSFLSFL